MITRLSITATLIIQSCCIGSIYQPSSSTTTVAIKNGDNFLFECPNITQPHSVENVTVVWTHNDQIWVKIADGRPLITRELTTVHAQKILNRDFVTLACNKHRYSFVYDGINAKFSMSIDNLKSMDAGVWKCEVLYTRMQPALNEPATESLIDVRNLKVLNFEPVRKSASAMPLVISSSMADEYHKRQNIADIHPDRRKPSIHDHVDRRGLVINSERGDYPITYTHADRNVNAPYVHFDRMSRPNGQSGLKRQRQSSSPYTYHRPPTSYRFINNAAQQYQTSTSSIVVTILIASLLGA